ncbi:MAG: aminomethyltransferase family protein [Rhodobacteraceae bacterium]|nr:aminomethyltransferase family protein [Paracoccaceae bacterium]
MFSPGLIRQFSNIESATGARAFPGFPGAAPTALPLPPRGARQVRLAAGDVISVRGLPMGPPVWIAAFDDRGADALGALGLTGAAQRDPTVTDTTPMRGWIAGQGGTSDRDPPVARLDPEAEILVLKAATPCDVWLLSGAVPGDLVCGAASAPVEVVHQPARVSTLSLPPPLGPMREEFTVSRATARAYRLRKGEVVQIIDAEGQQCSDFMAFRSAGLDQGLEQMIDSTVTRTVVGGAYPRPGLFDKFVDSDMRPMLSLVQDTVGRHDTFALACTARGYEERGFPGHVNCSDNISAEMADYGVRARAAWPAINFFFNSWIDRADNRIQVEEAWSRPGDYVAMRALDDLVCVSTACPDDIDPINGWNPTDIHVRIYGPKTRVRRAVAYREREDAPVAISEDSAFHPRLETLTQQFAPARDLWAAVTFPEVGTLGEYWACRNAVTLQDMSGLRKYDIVGPDAERLLQQAMTRDIARLAVWRGTYALMCDEQGEVIDDGTLFRLGEHLFRWCCGSEASARQLGALAEAAGLQVRITAMGSALPNLALQGPRSRELLARIVHTHPGVPALEHVKWFGVTMARLHDRDGRPFMLSRSGYTGELGYELFCAKSDALEVWDAVMAAGADLGITPMGTDALETIRIEAGLAAAGHEFAPGVDAFEAGLGFAVDMRKDAFVGRAALERNARDPRRLLKGLLMAGDDVPPHGAPVLAGERQVGVVTSATRSPSLECGIAMARIAVEHATDGTALDVGRMDGRMKRLSATVASVPFIDPKRERTRA